ncbi:Hypothetical predicted protein [Octopus vulgaris]|uniref:Uncharacterized protein n=1 Tax=Octopus vulgaris TaxID=6645 RepID=A0AA36BLT8_OCTVU|nr:Hypothetical predicted protein [Octopus vulgaris]
MKHISETGGSKKYNAFRQLGNAELGITFGGDAHKIRFEYQHSAAGVHYQPSLDARAVTYDSLSPPTVLD